MKRFYIIFVFVYICNIIYAQNNLYQLLNEVCSSITIPEYDRGMANSWVKTPDHFSDITIKDNILTINYSFKINDGGRHINGKFVPNIEIHDYTVIIDITASQLSRAANEYWHAVSINSADGIKIIKSIKGKYNNKETYYVDDWSIKVNSEALESKLYNTLNDIWTTNKSITRSPVPQAKTPSTSEYAYYKASGFAIKKSYALKEDAMFINAFNRQSIPDGLELISAYTCFQNAETQDPDYINVINIVVYRIDAPAEQTLAEYKKGLVANRFPCSNKTWNGLQGLEYTFKQDMGNVMLPTKAFYGYKGNKFYLIQIGALVDTDKKYSALLNSIKIL